MPLWLAGRRLAGVIAALWVLGTVLALMGTLQSLSHDSFDGLNNAVQIPFALPWFVLPVPALVRNHRIEAWIDAGWGCLNAALIYWWVARRPPLKSN